MHRLYLQIYATIVGILLIIGITLVALFALGGPEDHRGLAILESVAEQLVPAADTPPDVTREALERLASELRLSLALFDARGEPIASALLDSRNALPRPGASWDSSRFVRSRGAGLTAALHLSGGRWLVVRHPPVPHTPGAFLFVLLLVGAIVAVGSYPIVRRLTSRLERLQRRVEALGEGELGTRVEVEGADEVADLARSFNRAAGRIERLVEAQKALLAGASHELRSPLTRIRMAVELLQEEPRPELLARIVEDISDLDALIDELLLMARIDASESLGRDSEVDLEALVLEEAGRAGLESRTRTEPVRLNGDEILLRRMARSLLENARIHGGGDVEVELMGAEPPASGARLRVRDRGPGIAPEDRERVFEAFFRGSEATKTSKPGVGLGLALVRRIARLHGGEATYYPREGGGAVFEVTLPARM